MALFRRTDPRPPPPTDEEILNTLAAVALTAIEHDGAVVLTHEQEVALVLAQGEAYRRGLLR